MKLVVISDTHRKEKNIALPEGDTLIHCGDVDATTPENTIRFLDWFASRPHKIKIFVPGNHDFFFEEHPNQAAVLATERGVNLLSDTGFEQEGIKFWGSPWTPLFGDWAFMLAREQIKRRWAMIPADTDVLITHGPPRHIFDKTHYNIYVGCQDLKDELDSGRIQPKLHVFGHIHEGYGEVTRNGTTFGNAAQCDQNYNLKNKPLVFHL